VLRTTEEQIDILVANAGATWGGPFEPTPDWATKKVLDLNVRGIFNLVRLQAFSSLGIIYHYANMPCRLVPLMAVGATPEDPSRIIIVSSTAGSNVPHIGDHGTIMYSVSKAAAHHLSRNLAMELGPRNFTVNTVAPGFFPSKLANGLIDILGGDEGLRADNPRKRLGEPEDIAGNYLIWSYTGTAANSESRRDGVLGFTGGSVY